MLKDQDTQENYSSDHSESIESAFQSFRDDRQSRHVPEILAPAGGRKQFLAALGSGADAVYLGLKQFNARARAENFSFDDLSELIPLAKTYEMSVLVAINILIKEGELKDLIPQLARLERLGVTAIIVQDLGVARLIRDHFPGLRMHASTQLAVHNAAGVKAAQQIGFKRVVMAREMTATELRRIRSRFPREEVELEAFCHGSLCYSYSGLCFFSGAQDGRSGNRGECAYTCREPYRILSEPGHGFLFSMKDLDTTKDLGKLVDAGIDTLKIEGRKKDAQFVATVVRNYRQQLDTIFGRSTLRQSAPDSAREWLKQSAAASWEEMAYSYHRERTSLFLASRYHENVIDLANPTHKGVEVGKVQAFDRGRVRLVTTVPLARFDGLKIVVQGENFFHAAPQEGKNTGKSIFAESINRYRNDELQFSIREMRVNGRLMNEVPAGTEVEISVDAEGHKVRIGDLVYKTRSSVLKNKVEGLANVPDGYRLHSSASITLSVDVRASGSGEVKFEFAARAIGRKFYRGSYTLPAEPAKQAGGLVAGIRKNFVVFGEQNIEVDDLSFTSDGEYFLPPSQLRALKRELGEALKTALHADEDAQVSRTQAAIAASTDSLKSFSVDNKVSWSVKCDRIEIVNWLEELWEDAAATGLAEIVFEPKRSALSEADPTATVDKLQQFSRKAGVIVRLALPTVVRAWDEPFLKRWVQAFADAGESCYEVGNIGHRALLSDWGVATAGSLATDFSLYAMNSLAVRELAQAGAAQVTLSIEDDRESIAELLRAWPDNQVEPQVILYKDTPLFIAESCSLTALHNGCPTAKVCGYRSLDVENARGEKFVVAHENCKSIVYGESPFGLTQNREFFESRGVKRFRLDFLTRIYTREQFRRTFLDAQAGVAVPGTHTANFSGKLL
jgi:U32 family peptidase